MNARLLLALLVILVLPWPSLAASLDEIRERGVLRVAVKNEGAASRQEHNDPAHFQKRAFEVALAARIARHILDDGEALELHVYKQRQRLAAVAAGDVDLGISMFAASAKANGPVEFSRPYYSGGLVVMQRGDGTVRDLRDLDGLKLVAMAAKSHDPGGELRAAASAAGADVGIDFVRSFADGMARLDAGEVDGMVADYANLQVYVSAGHTGYRLSPLLTRTEYAVAVRKGDLDLLRAVNEVIAALAESGELAAMMRDAELPAPPGTAATP